MLHIKRLEKYQSYYSHLVPNVLVFPINSYLLPNTSTSFSWACLQPLFHPLHSTKPLLSFLHVRIIVTFSSTPHISITSMPGFPSCHLTPDVYLNSLWLLLHSTPNSLFVSANVSTSYIRADITEAAKALPLMFNSILWFTNKLKTFCHLPHTVTLALNAFLCMLHMHL